MPQLPKENVKLADQELNEVLARIGGRTHLSPTAARPHSSDDPDAIARDIAAISRIEAVPSLLQVLCDTTGMGFAAVARVTGGTWTACAVRDTVSFGLKPGGQLPLETTLCTEVRQSRNADSAGKPRTLFEPFFRHSISASREGLGLGLHICAQIVRAHAGRLDVESTAPSGTRFTARIPLLGTHAAG